MTIMLITLVTVLTNLWTDESCSWSHYCWICSVCKCCRGDRRGSEDEMRPGDNEVKRLTRIETVMIIAELLNTFIIGASILVASEAPNQPTSSPGPTPTRTRSGWTWRRCYAAIVAGSFCSPILVVIRMLLQPACRAQGTGTALTDVTGNRRKKALFYLLAWSLWIELASSAPLERLARLPNNVIGDFLAYRHVTIVHFEVPENAAAVSFKFTVKEEKLGGLGTCDSRRVMIHLKSGSLPFVNPDGSKIYARLLENRRRYYTIEAESNGDEHVINIEAPVHGDWYAIAYRAWHDPDSEKIKQQGLAVSCETVLDAELSVEMPDRLHQVSGEGVPVITSLAKPSESAVVQFQVPENAGDTNITVQSSCAENCALAVHVTADDHLLGQIVNRTDSVVLGFRPHLGRMHYAVLRLVSGEASNLTVQVESDLVPRTALARPRLIRKSLPDFFLFDYEHLSDNSSGKPVPMNLTTGALTALKFQIARGHDVGGSLSIGLRIPECEEDQRMILVGCVSHGSYANISSEGNCLRSGNERTAVDIFVGNHTSPGFVHVPFPEPGDWYLSVKTWCLTEGADRCECAELCAQNTTECQPGCGCARECSGRIETSISSSPCIDGGCNNHGRCQPAISGGVVFAACQCTGGYRGFDCADDTYVLSKTKTMTRMLALTMSNLAFIGAIAVAIRRGYYTEALAYASVMFFSTFYHACETGEEGHTFCLLKVNVLQFCDFFCALLSIWVTLVAMAAFGPQTTSFCQMLGVLFLAVGAELDRTALWVFLLPTVSGCVLVALAWAYKCRAKGTIQYPARIYRIVYLPIGLLVVFAGLIFYAFLQTRKNYYIMHSIWHVCVAVGVVLLLPKKEYME